MAEYVKLEDVEEAVSEYSELGADCSVPAVMERLLSAIRALPRSGEWWDIESAPEDGTMVWAWIEEWGFAVTAFYDDCCQWWMPARSNGRMAIPVPAAWQPAPKPPSTGPKP